jgi:hypothetical protein
MYPTKLEDGSWSDRAVPKYYTCPGMKRFAALFGFDIAMEKSKDSTVVVVEGPVDCLKVGGSGVATLGSKITNQQIRIITANWSEIIWILDQDIDTDSKWFDGVSIELSRANTLHYLKMQTAKDPGELSTEQIWEEIAQHKQNNE